MANEDWAAVGAAIKERRHSLGLTQQQAADRGGISLPSWSVIEGARQTTYRPATIRGVCKALAWPPDGITRILRGESPGELDDGRTGRADDVMDSVVLNFNAPPHEVPPDVVDAIKNMLRPYFEAEQ